jgi:hypothetical protein
MTSRYSPTIKLGAGTIAAGSPPTKRRPTKYDWDGARTLLEANPGLWILVFDEFTSGMYSFLREGGPVALQEMGGNLQLSLRDQWMVEKTKYGKLWLRWTPEDWTEEDQARAEAALQAGEAVI